MIMIDFGLVDVIYIELIILEIVVKIIEKECLDVFLLMMGGQIGLNIVLVLVDMGVLDCLGVEMIGVKCDVIEMVEDCKLFCEVMDCLGIENFKVIIVIVFVDEDGKKDFKVGLVLVMDVLEEIGLLVIICLVFIFGGMGGGVVYNCEEYEYYCCLGMDVLFVGQIFVDELLFGWKEYEMEVVCDKVDNVIIVCLIENVDLMGVYIGDLIIVVFVLMLIDKEYQIMCLVLIVVLCEIGVEMGGLNVQWVVNFKDGCMVVIEMNLCVLCLLVLVFKVIGFLIVKIVVKLVVGYMLDELDNDIIKVMFVLFELSIDYVVIKILCFVFEKFLGLELNLIIVMKLVGEVMFIGCIFYELV